MFVPDFTSSNMMKKDFVYYVKILKMNVKIFDNNLSESSKT